jgi:hypothetical protein
VFYNQIGIFSMSMRPISFLRLAALAGAAIFLAPVITHADDSDRFAAARPIAHAWLGDIDSGNYDQSYTEAGDALHQKVPQDHWVKILKTERPLLGRLVSRQEVTHSYRPDGLEGAEGEFIVLGYRSAFETKPSELEYVVLKHEFGGWRCVGYDFGPDPAAASGSDDGTAPTTTTTTETLTPPTPTNGITVPATRAH